MVTDPALLGPTLIPPPPPLESATTREEGIALRIAWVRWQAAELDAREEAARARNLQPHGSDRTPPARVREPVDGPTRVLSVRLDHAELAALERHAEFDGERPSVLARRFIRRGLASYDRGDLVAAVQDAVRVLAELQRRLDAAIE